MFVLREYIRVLFFLPVEGCLLFLLLNEEDLLFHGRTTSSSQNISLSESKVFYSSSGLMGVLDSASQWHSQKLCREIPYVWGAEIWTQWRNEARPLTFLRPYRLVSKLDMAHTTQQMSLPRTKKHLSTLPIPFLPPVTLTCTACHNSIQRQTPAMSQQTPVLP